MKVGEKIRGARIAKRMTQEELGNKIGVQKSAIAKYENGRVVNIKRSTLQKIAKVLDLRPSELIFEESVERDPVGTAERHFEMIMDEDLAEIFEDFKKLTPDEKAMVKKIVRGMANEDI